MVDGGGGLIREYIWPTHFWFVGAIFLYSAVLHLLVEKANIEERTSFIVFGIVVAVVDIISYICCIHDKTIWIVEDAYLGIVPFRSIYSIFAYVFGYYIKRNWEWVVRRLKQKVVACAAIVMFIGFYGFKFLLNRGNIPMWLQIISHPLTIMSALSIFLTFALGNLNPRLEKKRVGTWINTLSELSLESYLVQFLVIEWIADFEILFPVNMIICILLVMIFAWFLHNVSTILKKWILKILLNDSK